VRAKAAYRQAVQVDPAYAPARRELGLLLHADGRLEEACLELSEYVTLNPDGKDAGMMRGYITEIEGQLPVLTAGSSGGVNSAKPNSRKEP
jgi:tetratricopeptide (TPR) repeat protein